MSQEVERFLESVGDRLFTINDIIKESFGIKGSDITMTQRRVIGSLLRSYGWESTSVWSRDVGKVVRAWQKTGKVGSGGSTVVPVNFASSVRVRGNRRSPVFAVVSTDDLDILRRRYPEETVAGIMLIAVSLLVETSRSEILAKRSKMCVYFIRSEATGHIKIGWTTNIRDRMRDLQTSAPDRLTLLAMLATSNRKKEVEIHKMFADNRLNGEWFRCDARLMEFIASIEEQPEVSASGNAQQPLTDFA